MAMDAHKALKCALEFCQIDVCTIIHELRKLLPQLRAISEGKVHSEISAKWKNGNCKTRNGLTMRSNLINCVTGDTMHTIRDELASYFCSQSMKMFGYTMSVMVPEGIKMLIMKQYDLSDHEAELVMLTDIHRMHSEDDDSKGDMDASDLMKRAKKIESAKKGATARKYADDTSSVPITVSYMKKNKAGKFACDGTPVEVVLDRTSTYSDVIQKACEHLDVPRDSQRQLVLLTYGGAVIPEKEGWNLGQYMQQLHRGPGSTKLGVGFIKSRSVEDDQHTSHTSTSGYLSQVPSKTLDTGSMTSAVQDPLARKKTIMLSSDEESDSDSDFEIPKKKRKTTSTVKHAPKPAAPAERASRQLPQRPISAQSMEFFASELASATRNYARSTVIGKGGFGTVYKGYLRHSHVAIKVLSKKGQQAFMRAKPSVQFNTEVYMLSRHGNIVQLFGFCSKPSALIFEYMAKGSLFHNLHEVDIAETLNWEERTSILRDACRGLAFLHSATPPIVHQDIKSANVLIDEFKQAKLGDFGFSVELPHVSGGSTLFTAECIARTEGYYPSEITSGKISDRSDVYSFGVVVLEVYTACLVYCSKRQDPKLVDHLQEELLDFNKFQGLYDVMTDRPLDSLVETYFQVISACMRKHSARPSSAEVLRMLGN